MPAYKRHPNDTSGLKIDTTRIYSRTDILDVAVIDAIHATRAHPSEWALTPWPDGVEHIRYSHFGDKICYRD